MSKLSIPVSADDHLSGAIDADCILVEYGDYQCPSCGQAYPIVQRLQKHFGKRLTVAFRNFPLSQLHPWAEAAAEAAEFAAAHGKFWEMHDLLFENQESLGQGLLLELAEQLDLDPSELQSVLAQHSYQPRIRADFAGGVRSGVNGTPTFFVNGQRHNASFDFETLSDAIADVLKAVPPKASRKHAQ